ncbi:MAG: sigma factor-like helix-turn-helix DNA-binding protein [Lachnospiraceae bacterium]|nr:sigma factor-like helix-turn-helix DNA-binding protein [Lachnospiraceae bacterium]
MDNLYRETLLYDFYGDLLTHRQKQIFEEVVMNDLSLTEAAEEFGISRQGIHDMIRRCTNTMNDYESKLHLVDTFLEIRKKAEEIKAVSKDEKVNELADQILALL